LQNIYLVRISIYILIVILLGFSEAALTQSHPNLILTAAGVDEIRNGSKAPLFEIEIEQAKKRINASMLEGIIVPIPKDLGGGYTHEQHKRNYANMHLAGALYQLTKEEQYAKYVKDMLDVYLTMYPTLPIHPTKKSYSTGKIFWQCLNEANWLVYTAQAYDCIYDYLSKKERKKLEKELFKPFADFLSIENPKFFNRVHNHSTWGNAAVGMMALAMDDDELLDRALYGLPIKEGNDLEKDNDGGFIYEKGRAKAGFFAQIDNAFSPDGYYEEGPYYQRYAMTPFMLFAQALHHKKPELKIFEYRDGILLKAVDALLNQTDQSGAFFPINDAQKGMSIQSGSVISAVNIAYSVNKNPQLLSVAAIQNKVLLDQNGYAIARDLHDGKAEPFHKKSIELRDGKDGTTGALGILRTEKNEEEIALVFKYTSQGLGHGHFDKLSYAVYQGATEVLQDYGAARWVNIDQKAGGRYLKENKTWAKQTIAHNALVVDQTSHFNGKYEQANEHYSEPVYFEVSDPDFQIAVAKETNAYSDVSFQRCLMLTSLKEGEPIIIDLLTVESDNAHEYELPFHFQEHFLQSSVDLVSNDPPIIMGKKHGYQHLYQQASGTVDSEMLQFTWFNDYHTYSVSSLAEEGDELILGRIGANDPNFNLRSDALAIHRKKGKEDAIFLSVIEPHGDYSPVTETPHQPYSQIEDITLILQNDDYIIFSINDKSGEEHVFMFAKTDNNPTSKHFVNINGKKWEWTGMAAYQK